MCNGSALKVHEYMHVQYKDWEENTTVACNVLITQVTTSNLHYMTTLSLFKILKSNY